MDFIICTPEVNRKGYRILPEGIRLENFKKNPVALWVHDMDGWMNFPVGRWENLRIEGVNLVGSIVFSEEEQAQKIKRLAEEGVICATSMGHSVITYTEDPAYLMPGQTRATVTATELLEVSFVPVPANPGSVRLTLSNGGDPDNFLPVVNQQPAKMNKELLQALGLAEGASVEAAIAAVNKLNSDAAQVETLRAQAVDSLLAVGESKGIVNDKNREHYKTLGLSNLPSLKGIFDAEEGLALKVEGTNSSTTAPKEEGLTLTGLLSVLKQSGTGKPNGDERESWSFDQWSQKDSAGLLKMKKDDPEKYLALAAAKADAAGVMA